MRKSKQFLFQNILSQCEIMGRFVEMNYQIFKMNIERLTGETKQNKIADILHVSPSKLSKWFTGELLPTFTDILNISKAYQCSIDWLIGNEYKNKRNLSEYDICKLLIELDRKFFLNIELREIEQKITFVDNDNKLIADQEYNQTIPVIYFPNSISLEHIAITEELYDPYNEMFESTDEDILKYEGCENEKDIINSTSFCTNISINGFLIKYVQLKEAFYKKIIPLNVLDDIIDSYLKYMDKSTNVCEKNIFFNIPGTSSPEEKIEIAIKRYATEENVQFKTEE